MKIRFYLGAILSVIEGTIALIVASRFTEVKKKIKSQCRGRSMLRPYGSWYFRSPFQTVVLLGFFVGFCGNFTRDNLVSGVRYRFTV